jgi:hypothetical protein
MADEKKFVEVNLDSDPHSEVPFYGADWDVSGGSVRRLGVPTISESELLHNDMKKIVESEFVPDEPNESLAGLLDYYFTARMQSRIRARLPPSESLADYPSNDPKATYDSIRVISAAIELAFTERDIEMRPGPGRKRQGREVKKGCAVRLEPRHRTALKGFGLDLQTVADGLADLVDRCHDKEDEDAELLLLILGALFFKGTRNWSITTRLEPENVERWAVARAALLTEEYKKMLDARVEFDATPRPDV